MSYSERITIEAGKRGGKPCIRDLRITVYDVLSWLADGMSESEIIEDYPEFMAEDIKACLAFAASRKNITESGNLSQFLSSLPLNEQGRSAADIMQQIKEERDSWDET